MKNLKYLELQRLIKELQFVESNYVYQNEIVNQSELLFTESVNRILNNYPELKNIWDDKLEKNNNLLNSSIMENNVEINIEEIDVVNEFDISPNIKKIYREIVKNTHPDVVINRKLNELYLEATLAHDSNDIITLYKICNELMIDFELNEEEIEKIKLKIEQYKNKICFLESTYTFEWLKSEDKEKEKIVLKFIENIIK
jgi:hypothetical protein